MPRSLACEVSEVSEVSGVSGVSVVVKVEPGLTARHCLRKGVEHERR